MVAEIIINVRTIPGENAVTNSEQARTTVTHSIGNSKIPFAQHPASKVLEQLIANPRVTKIRVIVPVDACPVCRQIEGEYEKSEVPELPTLSCSRPNACCAFYEPSLTEIFP